MSGVMRASFRIISASWQSLSREEMVITFVLGTRSEITKAAAVACALHETTNAQTVLFLTGQQHELTRQALEAFSMDGVVCDGPSLVTPPDDWQDWRSTAQVRMTECLRQFPADLVVVVGDTSSALLGAEIARAHEIPVCHLEAGVRHEQLSPHEPEELIRRSITSLATFHFAPTWAEAENLLNEGVSKES